MKNLFNYLLLLALAALLLACGGNVDLDNGGEEHLSVLLAGVKHEVGAGQTIDVKLEPGMHQIKATDLKGEVVLDTVIQVGNGGLINLAGIEYVVWKDIFSPMATLDMRKELLQTRELVIGNQTLDVDFENLSTDRLYLEQHWDYRLAEPFPKKVYGWELEGDDQYMFKTKLVRKKDFMKVYLESTQ